MKLSVVIPVYKTEEYLRECIDSVLIHANQDVEVILVDDGSPDCCPVLCDELAEKDERVKVVHKENGGLSSARNAGLAVAGGAYVTFVDSDDLIDPDSILPILDWIKNEDADLCFLRAEKLFPDGTRQDLGEGIERARLHGQSREKAIAHLSSRPKYPGCAWAKLYRREFLLHNQLHFPYDRRYSEDLGFMRDCILHAERFDFLDVPYYRYRQNRAGSITNRVSAKNFNDLHLFITESIDKLTINKRADDAVNRAVMSFVAYEYSVLLHLYHHLPAENQQKALDKLKDCKWVLKYANSAKVKIISFVCLLFGVRFASFFVGKVGSAIRK